MKRSKKKYYEGMYTFDELFDELQAYRDWLAKEIRKYRKGYIANYKNQSSSLFILRYCAKALREKV